MMKKHIKNYTEKLAQSLGAIPAIDIARLGDALQEAWNSGSSVYLCGNGGSAANAMHLANDLLYGAGVTNGGGLKAEALSSNPAVLTCLANDLGYDQIYSEQLRVKANPGDVLIVLSGSGNSPSVVSALEMGNRIGMKTFAILGFSGGSCKRIAQHSIHFEVDDVQIAEDLQLMVGHMCMQWLCSNPLKRETLSASTSL